MNTPQAAIKVQGFYTWDCHILVYSFLSIYQVLGSLPLTGDTILHHINTCEMLSTGDVKVLYVSHHLLSDVDINVLSTKELASLMIQYRLAKDNIFDSDLLEQVLPKNLLLMVKSLLLSHF